MTNKENTIGVNNPHDKVFRENYGDPDNARSTPNHKCPGVIREKTFEYMVV